MTRQTMKTLANLVIITVPPSGEWSRPCSEARILGRVDAIMCSHHGEFSAREVCRDSALLQYQGLSA